MSTTEYKARPGLSVDEEDEDGSIQIIIRLLSEKSLCLDVRRSMKIKSVKERIMKTERVPGLHQILIFAGKQLTDEKTLLECNVCHGSTLHFINRLREGGENDDWKTGLKKKDFGKLSLQEAGIELYQNCWRQTIEWL